MFRTEPGDRGRASWLVTIVITAAAVPGLFSASGCTMINGVAAGVRNEVWARPKRTDYKFDALFTVEDPQFRRTMDSIADGMVEGNTATLLNNGVEIFPAMTADIRAARASVNLETFLYENDEAGRLFADAMIEAVGRGVEVRLLVDGWGANLGDLRGELEGAGVIVQEYRPLKLYTLNRPGIRTHRKLLIVDGRIGYTGGLGIDERWLGDARNPDEWRETQVRVTGPVVAQMQAIFSENWVYSSAEILAGDTFFPQLEPTGDILAHALKSSKGDSSSLPKQMYVVAIKSSRRSIHIHNPYFIPDTQVRRALVEAVQRGVDVQVIVPGRHHDIPLVRQSSRSHFGELLEGGVKIFEYVPTMMHLKALVIDEIFSTIGSINFDVRSMQINAEESLSFYDRPFAEKMEAMFQDDKRRCREVTLEQWENRSFAARSAEWFSWIWEPYY
ncbi:MAG: phosphatidylserine/phosphatidylglycerophosphate/cardiolipin synthase family protein [Candidatus Binatia bacterium]